MTETKDNVNGVNRFILPNGLRIVHEPTASRVAYCGFAVDAGTRDETDDTPGMAHFVEHLLFKARGNAVPGTS